MVKIWQIYSWGTIALTLLFLLLIGYWSFYPYKPLVFKDIPLKVLNTKVKTGDLLTFESYACKNVSIPGEIARAYINSVIYNTPTILSNNPAGCNKMVVTMEIPDLPAGIYHVRNTYTYQVNPIREVVIEVNTENFEIVK